jgi:hypothetical protein
VPEVVLAAGSTVCEALLVGVAAVACEALSVVPLLVGVGAVACEALSAVPVAGAAVASVGAAGVLGVLVVALVPSVAAETWSAAVAVDGAVVAPVDGAAVIPVRSPMAFPPSSFPPNLGSSKPYPPPSLQNHPQTI